MDRTRLRRARRRHDGGCLKHTGKIAPPPASAAQAFSPSAGDKNATVRGASFGAARPAAAGRAPAVPRAPRREAPRAPVRRRAPAEAEESGIFNDGRTRGWQRHDAQRRRAQRWRGGLARRGHRNVHRNGARRRRALGGRYGQAEQQHRKTGVRQHAGRESRRSSRPPRSHDRRRKHTRAYSSPWRTAAAVRTAWSASSLTSRTSTVPSWRAEPAVRRQASASRADDCPAGQRHSASVHPEAARKLEFPAPSDQRSPVGSGRSRVRYWKRST